MPDIFTKRKRSEVMSRIRGAGNKATELRLIQIFRANGIISLRQPYGSTSGLAAAFGCPLGQKPPQHELPRKNEPRLLRRFSALRD